MTEQLNAMKQALEALGSCTPGDYSTGHVIHPSYNDDAVEKAITALEQAIKEAEQPAIKQDLTPEQWEPINPKFVRNVDGVPCITLIEHEHIVKQITSPAHVATPRVPERPSRSDMKPLTDERITGAIRTSSLYMKPSPHTPQSIWLALLMGYARAIEAAHGITGETK